MTQTRSSYKNMSKQSRKRFLDGLLEQVQRIQQQAINLTDSDDYENLYQKLQDLRAHAAFHCFQLLSAISQQMQIRVEQLQQDSKLEPQQKIDRLSEYTELLIKTSQALIDGAKDLSQIEQYLHQLTLSNSHQLHNVLVVESSRLHAELVKQALQTLPVSIDLYDDGIQALCVLLQVKYDIIICSMETAELNGEALTAAIRLSKRINRHSKVILLTSKSTRPITRNTDPDIIIKRDSEVEFNLHTAVDEFIKQMAQHAN